MDDIELELVATGQRKFTKEERDWAISQHDWLWEYVCTQDTAKRESMSDSVLAKEVQSASWDYVRCECI